MANEISPHEEDDDTPWAGEHVDRLFVASKLDHWLKETGLPDFEDFGLKCLGLATASLLSVIGMVETSDQSDTLTGVFYHQLQGNLEEQSSPIVTMFREHSVIGKAFL